jgi:integrase
MTRPDCRCRGRQQRRTLEPRHRALVLTAAYGGCRWGELAGLKQPDLDLLHLRLTPSRPSTSAAGERIIAPPETSAGRRVVNLPAGVVSALELHLDQFVKTNPRGSCSRPGPARRSPRTTSATDTGFSP